MRPLPLKMICPLNDKKARLMSDLNQLGRSKRRATRLGGLLYGVL